MTVGVRSYGQMCPIARSLDVLGERWTLLIVRELLLGPKRFRDLMAQMPAMGTNRLSTRLKALEGDGVIERTTLPAAGSTPAYALTERGEALRAPVVALAQWGAGVPIDDRIDPATARAELLALVRCATAPRDQLAGTREIHDLAIGKERFHILINDGTALPRSGPSPIPADLTVECDLPTLIALASGALTVAAARRRGASIKGPDIAVQHFTAIFTRD